MQHITFHFGKEDYWILGGRGVSSWSLHSKEWRTQTAAAAQTKTRDAASCKAVFNPSNSVSTAFQKQGTTQPFSIWYSPCLCHTWYIQTSAISQEEILCSTSELSSTYKWRCSARGSLKRLSLLDPRQCKSISQLLTHSHPFFQTRALQLTCINISLQPSF